MLDDKTLYPSQLKVIPYFTGHRDINDVLKNKKALSLLWLEILFNDDFDWDSKLESNEITIAYEKACIWYNKFKYLIEISTRRKPLEEKQGVINYKEYRRFIEVLNFVTA